MQHSSLPSGSVQAHCLRLNPGEDLVQALQDAAKSAIANTRNAGSAFVLSAVGSLSDVTLRLASASCAEGNSKSNETRRWCERLEVVSLVGTFTPTGAKHLHMSVANAQGDTFGGHLVAGTVFTTLELILGTIADVNFSRVLDDRTGYSELVVRAVDPSVLLNRVIHTINEERNLADENGCIQLLTGSGEYTEDEVHEAIAQLLADGCILRVTTPGGSSLLGIIHGPSEVS